MRKNIYRIVYTLCSVVFNFIVWMILIFPVGILVFDAIIGKGINGHLMGCVERLLQLIVVLIVIIILIIINYGMYKIFSKEGQLEKGWLIIPIISSVIGVLYQVINNI